MSGANLIEADLRGADMSRANLSKADLCGADMSKANLKEAIYDTTTRWPDGFDPVSAGASEVDQKLPDETSVDESGQT